MCIYLETLIKGIWYIQELEGYDRKWDMIEIKYLKIDGGGEYHDRRFKDYYALKAIRLKFIVI